MPGGTVTVSREWYETVLGQMSAGCPFCGSRREPLVKPSDELFLPRTGCLDCNRWWTPPQLRE